VYEWVVHAHQIRPVQTQNHLASKTLLDRVLMKCTCHHLSQGSNNHWTWHIVNTFSTAFSILTARNSTQYYGNLVIDYHYYDVIALQVFEW
jgi:hypothetical protein